MLLLSVNSITFSTPLLSFFFFGAAAGSGGSGGRIFRRGSAGGDECRFERDLTIGSGTGRSNTRSRLLSRLVRDT